MQTRSILHIHIHRRLSRHVALFVYLSPNCNASAQREQSLALVLSRLQLPPQPPTFSATAQS